MSSKKVSVKTINISQGNLEDIIAQFLYAIGEVPHSKDIRLLSLGHAPQPAEGDTLLHEKIGVKPSEVSDPEYASGGDYVSLAFSREHTIPLRFMTLEPQTEPEVKQYNFKS